MEFWLDTIDFEFIENATKTLNIYGITTNPSILAKSSLDFNSTIKKLLDIQDGLVAIQVIADDVNNIIKEAEKIYALSNRIIIKIPVTRYGLEAMNYLTKKNIPILATSVFQLKQLILSANVGASYIAPYLGRMENCFDVVKDMLNIIKINKYSIKIMGAAVRNADYILETAKLGVHALTIPQQVIQEFLNEAPPGTTDSLAKFHADWNSWKFKDSFMKI